MRPRGRVRGQKHRFWGVPPKWGQKGVILGPFWTPFWALFGPLARTWPDPARPQYQARYFGPGPKKGRFWGGVHWHHFGAKQVRSDPGAPLRGFGPNLSKVAGSGQKCQKGSFLGVFGYEFLTHFWPFFETGFGQILALAH